MDPWGWVLIAAAVAAVIVFVMALCKVAGDCSREEERADYERNNGKR